MEGDDFDFYKGNRGSDSPAPVPNDHVIIMEVPSSRSKVESVPNKPSLLKKYMVVIIAFAVCVALLVGVLLIALIGPMLSGDTMNVYINEGGHRSGDVLYMDTDSVELSIRNEGKGTVEGDRLYFMISGKNIVKERIDFTGGDIGPGKNVDFMIRVQVVDELAPFTLTVRMYYKDRFMDSDSIP
jgi:hypothetical protein